MRIFNSEIKSEVTDEDRKKYIPGVEVALVETRKDYQEKAERVNLEEIKSYGLAGEFHT